MYHSVVLITFTELYNHHPNWFLEYFHHSKKKPCRNSRISFHSPFSHTPQPQATISLLSVSVDLPILVQLCMCVHSIYYIQTFGVKAWCALCVYSFAVVCVCVYIIYKHLG